MITHDMIVKAVYKVGYFLWSDEKCKGGKDCHECCEHTVTKYENAIKAAILSDIANKCRYLLNSDTSKKKSLEQLIRILEKNGGE